MNEEDVVRAICREYESNFGSVYMHITHDVYQQMLATLQLQHLVVYINSLQWYRLSEMRQTLIDALLKIDGFANYWILYI